MIKRMTKHGNSQALVIEKPILDLLNIDDNTMLEVTTDGHRLIVTPISDGGENKKKFEKGLTELNKKHASGLKRLPKT
ncbi:MAG TPA: AbrB/MazE/SpoVT family DNA-binding domain-containing protein [Oculatellaceae cyanobacterium]